ncbi:uncharacterized protein TNCV_3832001 [Trichonephila clavipes]|nr:uncharacterized protein TNCV_3832001 [Trichonephila clavipes]
MLLFQTLLETEYVYPTSHKKTRTHTSHHRQLQSITLPKIKISLPNSRSLCTSSPQSMGFINSLPPPEAPGGMSEIFVFCLRYSLRGESDEAHFWLNGYVNKQNCRIWSEANPQVYVETPLHPEKLTVWCAFWAGGILLQKR